MGWLFLSRKSIDPEKVVYNKELKEAISDIESRYGWLGTES